MSTCKDCLHNNICEKLRPIEYCLDKPCSCFKPKADFVEVVRCKDCQYAKPYERNDGQTGYYCQHQNCTFLYGTNWERLFKPIKEANDFCSYGEKKESEVQGE